MKAVCIFRRGLAHHRFWCEAFADGLRRHGIKTELHEDSASCADLMVVWGVRHKGLFGRQRIYGGEICVLERGYVGDREAWTSVSFGGHLNGRAEFRGPLDDASRWQKFFPDRLKPGVKRDGYALIMGQVPNDQSLAGVHIDRWYAEAVKTLRRQGHDVRFRPHPLASKVRVPGCTALKGSLAEALAGASFVVTFNSNSAVDAALDGIPTVAVDAGSMAYEVSGHEVCRPSVSQERGRWAAALAWKQFSEDEMRSGFAWSTVTSR